MMDCYDHFLGETSKKQETSAKSLHLTSLLYTRNLQDIKMMGHEQCWEGYFGNVIGYIFQVTLFQM